ncbi:hypothetical protein AB0J82_21835 [Asanoa sp. NPDC049518]|uniref:hypothetical protein n=1 Tax=unclassified Asanoa TaxID=2685164 RepID=UPI003443C4FB
MTWDRTPKDDEIQPCRITIPDDEPVDLWDRLARVRWARPLGPTTVPVGVAQFPDDLASVRTFAEHQHTNIISWNHCDRGGHYAARDAPDLLVADIRQLFATLRS